MTTKATPRGYHHGDLRATLLRVGLELVAERGITGFTLREVARRAGVSHAAPYHHFADRGALVRSIVAESYAALAAALEDAAARGGEDPLERIQAMGEGYVAFALASPDRYRLMFRSELAGDGSEADEVDRTGAAAFGALVNAVEEAHRAGRLAEDVDVGTMAAACWATVHGVASLLLDGALGIRADQTDRARQLARRLIGITLRGLAG
jgi:AcrR family transcriptional regulator